jgi:YD repeat-containing protein
VTVDPSGLSAVTAIDYNLVGDITKITRSNGAYLQYTYDDARRITKVQDNSGAWVEYDRDKLGRHAGSRTPAGRCNFPRQLCSMSLDGS